MRITYNQPRLAQFRTLKPGEMFRDNDNTGLFLKIVPYAHHGCHGDKAVAVVIDGTDVKPGEPTGWDLDDIIIPVRSIVVDFEELK